MVSRLIRIARGIRRLWLPLPWGGEPREFLIDLRGVSSRDDFQRELTRHFPIAADHLELWGSLYRALYMEQAGPYRLRFLGWVGFEKRMPRYAKRLRRLLLDHQRLWFDVGGVQLLTVEFDEPVAWAAPACRGELGKTIIALLCYRKSRLVKETYASTLEEPRKKEVSKSPLAAAQRRALREERSRVSADLRAVFDNAFDAWKSTWFSEGLAMSSDPGTRAVGKEFDTLIAMGPAILPLVVEKLADPENFLALQLYDAIQPDEHLIVQYGSEDERILEGEQGRARRVVETWLANR
jgi:hypothetical protein